jgi:hypothetical protein
MILSSQINPFQPFFIPERIPCTHGRADGLFLFVMVGRLLGNMLFDGFIHRGIHVPERFMDIGRGQPSHFNELDDDFLGRPKYLFIN